MSVQQDEEYRKPQKKKEEKKEKPIFERKWTETRNIVHLSLHVFLFAVIVALVIVGGIFFKDRNEAFQIYEAKLEEEQKLHFNNVKTTENVYEARLKEYKDREIPTDVLILYLNSRVDPELAKIIGKHVELNAKKFNLPVNLILSIIHAESNFNPFAESKVGAKGLMQVFPKAHRERINGANLFHIDENVRLGCEIFREYLNNEKGNFTKTIHAYLSKNATQEELWKYKINILDAWAKLNMYYYLQKTEKEEETKDESN